MVTGLVFASGYLLEIFVTIVFDQQLVFLAYERGESMKTFLNSIGLLSILLISFILGSCASDTQSQIWQNVYYPNDFVFTVTPEGVSSIDNTNLSKGIVSVTLANNSVQNADTNYEILVGRLHRDVAFDQFTSDLLGEKPWSAIYHEIDQKGGVSSLESHMEQESLLDLDSSGQYVVFGFRRHLGGLQLDKTSVKLLYVQDTVPQKLRQKVSLDATIGGSITLNKIPSHGHVVTIHVQNNAVTAQEILFLQVPPDLGYIDTLVGSQPFWLSYHGGVSLLEPKSEAWVDVTFSSGRYAALSFFPDDTGIYDMMVSYQLFTVA